MNTRIELFQQDITTLQVDAIVNAANSSLMGGGGVDGAIHRKGGPLILEECVRYTRSHGTLPAGEAMITSGGNLPAKFVIHTVGPVWNGGTKNEALLLGMAYKNSLELAIRNNLTTIAFPNISTGVYRFPKAQAAEIALKTVRKFLSENTSLLKVIFACFDEENYLIYKTKLEED
jgi:O-acetyl-ADP-ribose deacetylase (regulator of RNase III)